MIRAVPVDPYNPTTGLLVPFVANRMLEFARKYAGEVRPEVIVEGYMTRLWQKDPYVLILAFVDEKGTPVGHLAASIESDGAMSNPATSKWVFISQCKFDDNVGDSRWDAMSFIDQWGAAAGARTIMFSTAGPNPPKWAAKYGFKARRVVMERAVGASMGEQKESE